MLGGKTEYHKGIEDVEDLGDLSRTIAEMKQKIRTTEPLKNMTDRKDRFDLVVYYHD